MKFYGNLLLFGTAACLLGQTPPPKPPQPAPVPHIELGVDNPGVKTPAPQVPPDKVIITVGNVKITAAQFDLLVETLQPQYRTLARGTGRRQFADNIVQMFTLAEEAQRTKLTDSSDYKTKLMFQNANLMASMMVEQLGKVVQVPDADLLKYYNDHKSDYEQVHAKHILIRFQGSSVQLRPGQKDLSDAEALAKAQDLRKKLQDGADFAQLAKTESDDTSSGMNGGDMPAFHHGQMVPSFETAAFAMKPGELSEPVKSQFGYHVILVVSHDNKSFDESKADIEKTLKPQQTQKAVTQAIQDLEKTNPPVLDPEFFGPEKAPVPPASDKK